MSGLLGRGPATDCGHRLGFRGLGNNEERTDNASSVVGRWIEDKRK